MLTSELAEGVKTRRMGRCTLHEGRLATEMLPKGPKMEPRGPKKRAKGNQNEQKDHWKAPEK